VVNLHTSVEQLHVEGGADEALLARDREQHAIVPAMYPLFSLRSMFMAEGR
jgi:hypothetical protein